LGRIQGYGLVIRNGATHPRTEVKAFNDLKGVEICNGPSAAATSFAAARVCPGNEAHDPLITWEMLAHSDERAGDAIRAWKNWGDPHAGHLGDYT